MWVALALVTAIGFVVVQVFGLEQLVQVHFTRIDGSTKAKDLHGMDIWVALPIATFKASLVTLFFMHMWWDKGLNRVLFLSSFVFATLFIGLTLMDKQNYQDTVRDYPVVNRPAPPVPFPGQE